VRKIIASAVVLVAALALTVPGALGGATQTPGVTAKTITIGGTFPLTGRGAYAPICSAQDLRHYMNAQGPDGKRGITAGRSSTRSMTTATTPRTRSSSPVDSSSRTRCSPWWASSGRSRSRLRAPT
jgi:hypothetical protein